MPMKFFLLGLLSFSTVVSAQSWKKFHLINNCHVMDMSGNSIKTFPGNLCQFMDDGSYLTANLEKLRYLDKNNAVLWEKTGLFHHQLNLSADKKKILVLSNSSLPEKKKLQDHLLVLDFKGNVLHEVHSSEYLKQLKRPDHSYALSEITHINSFYEIPEMDPKLKLPAYIKAGNYILNDYHLGAFIVTPDLKTILHFFPMESSKKNQTHDVQILSNGKMIYFNNVTKSESNNLFSSIGQTDLETGKDEILFSSQPEGMFFSLYCGGIQKLDDDHILFSHMLTGTYIYSLRDKKLLSNIYRTHLLHEKFYPAQQVKAQDLSHFMSRWK